jgi:hypothetical protein
LLGKSTAEAHAIIEGEGAGVVKSVEHIPQGSLVTMDFREDRVRIFAGLDGKVTMPAPSLG